MRTALRKTALLLAIGLTLTVSACSAPESNAPATGFAAPAGEGATPTPSKPPVHNQEVDEADGYYHDDNEYVSKWTDDNTELRPMTSDHELVAENLNWFLYRITYEWKESPSRAYPADTPTRKVFPQSAMFLSDSIPEYQAKVMTSTITNTVEEWRDVRFMVDGREIEFTKDGRFAKVGLDIIEMEASPNMGLFNGLSGKQSGSGYFILAKEDGDWKISGIGGRFADYDCLTSCSLD